MDKKNIIKAPREKIQDTHKGLEMRFLYLSLQFWILEENEALPPKFREKKLSILKSAGKQKARFIVYARTQN